jgi:L-lysine 6-transaminase
MPYDDISAQQALDILKQHILVDGFHIVLDPLASRGARMRDALSGLDYVDFYGQFASQPIGFNHPRLREPEYQARLLTAAAQKIANADVYTKLYAQFVQTVAERAGLPPLYHWFFIDGGTLAVENGLKAAFDWKVRKNLAAGRGEIGSKVLHFRQAFHGRSGYALSLTNTEPAKILYFPKFDWPRIDNPGINFALPEPQRTQDVAAREAAALAQIEQAVARHGHDIACVIVEPIQCEGGDIHFRGEFLRSLREVCDRHEMLLVFDEVQTGVGITGKMWCCQHFEVVPDILVFGKKLQTCGLIAGPRLDEVDSVFKVPSRINSTWGGNLTDMVRSTQFLRIIAEEKLVENAARVGAHLQARLHELSRRHPLLSAPRGRGLLCAIDLPDRATRDRVRQACWQNQLMTLACGDRSLRFRPVLDVTTADIDAGIEILDRVMAAT